MAVDENVKAVRIGDRIILFIDGKRQTIARKVAPEAFASAVKFIEEKDTDSIRKMFSNVTEKISKYAQDIFTIKGNDIFAKGSNIPAPKLVARKLFEMMQVDASPKPLLNLDNKMKRNNKGIASGMEVFAKLDGIPMTECGNLVLKVGMSNEDLDKVLQKYGTVVGSPLNSNDNSSVQHDLPICNFEEREIYDFVYCLVDPADIMAFIEYNGEIRVGRYKILLDFKFENKPVINVPLEKLYDISYNIWNENQSKINKSIAR